MEERKVNGEGQGRTHLDINVPFSQNWNIEISNMGLSGQFFPK